MCLENKLRRFSIHFVVCCRLSVKVKTLRFFYKSPNLTWFVMALVTHIVFPYDIQAASGQNLGEVRSWLLRRLSVNGAIAFSYYSFFFYGLYIANWGSRKFRPGLYPTLGNMMHNFWYWSLGILQWTFLEYIMCRCWASGYVSFATNEQVR